MVFHQGALLYMADQPQNQPVSARACRMEQAEPEEITIMEQEAQAIRKYPQNQPWHKGAYPIGVYLDGFLQVGIRCESLPLKAELDYRKGFVTKNHPAKSVNKFMCRYTQYDRYHQKGRIEG